MIGYGRSVASEGFVGEREGGAGRSADGPQMMVVIWAVKLRNRRLCRLAQRLSTPREQPLNGTSRSWAGRERI